MIFGGSLAQDRFVVHYTPSTSLLASACLGRKAAGLFPMGQVNMSLFSITFFISLDTLRCSQCTFDIILH